MNALNPSQTPADVSDCPVFASTKEAQYRLPAEFSKYFSMFVGLHIEQCLLVTHGHFDSALLLTADWCFSHYWSRRCG